ncbi:MAG: DUF2163 domain-containing protein [Bradyrhizobiaceae bacterium]|nr:DUF2163 domain-containing protein [Bradyrhizobiaceae bacterium]
MRNLPPALAAHLASGATTLCRCWRLTRGDEVVQGFTDHDEDLVFDGTTFRAGTGFEGTELEARFGLSVTGTEVHGALAAESLNEADLAAGRYDNAKVELFFVNWAEVEQRLLLRVGHLGEVRREGAAFAAEVRGLAARLNEERGRIYAATCDADLGDARCGVDLDDPALRGEGSVLAVEGGSLIRVAGLDAFADGWFTRGKLTFSAGPNAGLAVEVKEHRAEAGEVRLALWQQMPAPIAEGDLFAVTAGCDKRFETCRSKFANAINFRGFPHMPGNDFVVAYTVPGEPGHDGSPAR